MSPSTGNTWQLNPASGFLGLLSAYKDTVVRLFSALPGRVLDECSISPVDALALGYFLEHYPRRVLALEIGAFVGVSAFFLASHQNVSKVISVDPNPTVADELTANPKAWTGKVDLAQLKNLRVLDVARATLAEFGDVREKIELREGVVGSAQMGAKDGTMEVPVVERSDEASLVAFVGGLRTREGVRTNLEVIFERNPRAVAFLDDCRHARGPFVQAGAVDFMQQAPDGYHFDLIADLGPGLSTSNLALVYPNSGAVETRKVLEEVGNAFSQRLDPLRLLRREEDLIAAVNRANQEVQQVTAEANRATALEEENERLKNSNSRLQENNGHLNEANTRLKDYVAQLREINTRLEQSNVDLRGSFISRVLRIPAMVKLLRQEQKPPSH